MRGALASSVALELRGEGQGDPCTNVSLIVCRALPVESRLLRCCILTKKKNNNGKSFVCFLKKRWRRLDRAIKPERKKFYPSVLTNLTDRSTPSRPHMHRLRPCQGGTHLKENQNFFRSSPRHRRPVALIGQFGVVCQRSRRRRSWRVETEKLFVFNGSERPARKANKAQP